MLLTEPARTATLFGAVEPLSPGLISAQCGEDLAHLTLGSLSRCFAPPQNRWRNAELRAGASLLAATGRN